jgi:hypothetical protein
MRDHSNNEKEFQKVYRAISKNLKTKKWNCIVSDCKSIAINSHLLQRNGILNSISENNHVVEIKSTDTFKWDGKVPPLELKRVGLNNALSLSLFCADHDSAIFKKIETPPLDFCNYQMQLLLSYRVICAELRKKELNVELFTRLLNSETLYGSLSENHIKTFLKGSQRGIEDIKIYKAEFEKELNDNSKEFDFVTIKYPLIKIYGSAAFSPYETSREPFEQIPVKYIFIHIIPYDNELNIIIGYSKKYVKPFVVEYINSWKNLTLNDLEHKLTTLFATQIENWGLSPNIFQNINKRTLNSFVKYFSDNALEHSIHQKVDFNLFENMNYGI